MRQGWDQTLIEDSSPILHCKSCLTTTRDAWILCIKLGVWPKLVSKKFPIGKYLALNTCVIRVSWFVINFQPYFLSMARLKACKCLKIISPNSFFMVNFSQLSQLIPLIVWSLEPHQNELIILCNSSSRVDGSKKKNTHAISGNWLSNRFKKNFYTRHRDVFTCPIMKTVPNYVLNIWSQKLLSYSWL